MPWPWSKARTKEGPTRVELVSVLVDLIKLKELTGDQPLRETLVMYGRPDVPAHKRDNAHDDLRMAEPKIAWTISWRTSRQTYDDDLVLVLDLGTINDHPGDPTCMKLCITPAVVSHLDPSSTASSTEPEKGVHEAWCDASVLDKVRAAARLPEGYAHADAFSLHPGRVHRGALRLSFTENDYLATVLRGSHEATVLQGPAKRDMKSEAEGFLRELVAQSGLDPWREREAVLFALMNVWSHKYPLEQALRVIFALAWDLVACHVTRQIDRTALTTRLFKRPTFELLAQTATVYLCWGTSGSLPVPFFEIMPHRSPRPPMMPASYGSFSLHEEDGRWRANASEVQHTLAAVFALSRAPVPDTHRGAVTKAAIETCVEEIRMLSSARYLLTLEQWDQALLAILAEEWRRNMSISPDWMYIDRAPALINVVQGNNQVSRRPPGALPRAFARATTADKRLYLCFHCTSTASTISPQWRLLGTKELDKQGSQVLALYAADEMWELNKPVQASAYLHRWCPDEIREIDTLGHDFTLEWFCNLLCKCLQARVRKRLISDVGGEMREKSIPPEIVQYQRHSDV